jgi:chemotaxis family two-component system response regulator Rcp1
MAGDRSIHVLIVDDNFADVLLLKNALEEEAACEFQVIQHGDRAYEYLGQSPSDGVPWPDVIVLDLNLPGRDGAEVLDLIRSSPTLAPLTVAVVSSSPKDVLKQRAAHADCYVTKPVDLDEFLKIGKEILDCYRANAKRAATDSP